MAIIYRTYQDNRDGSITQGQWFGRAVHTDTIGLKGKAMEIEENVSVKYSDVSADAFGKGTGWCEFFVKTVVNCLKMINFAPKFHTLV